MYATAVMDPSAEMDQNSEWKSFLIAVYKKNVPICYPDIFSRINWV